MLLSEFIQRNLADIIMSFSNGNGTFTVLVETSSGTRAINVVRKNGKEYVC